MPGLYLHIPFCKQACHYCNFHFSTSLKNKKELIAALQKEIIIRKDELDSLSLSTIYLGGGTPSLLSSDELQQIFETINQHYNIDNDAEITLEANPDDLSKQYLQSLCDTAINRLSIGIQSFFDEDLKFMNRAHKAEEAQHCIENAQAAGFYNLTIDLIYGTPGLSDDKWKRNLAIAFEYKIPHISSYCLTVEPNTALDHFVKKGKAPAVDEEQAARQFEILMQKMSAAGYDHYEISNFARPGFYAKHNSNYWKGAPYLGIGPAAHSFVGQTRRWNVAHNPKYIQILQSEHIDGLYEEEHLSAVQIYNEYVMTGLRTIWGCDFEKIKGMGPSYSSHFLAASAPWVEAGKMKKQDDQYLLTNDGRLLADRIAMELFIEE